VSDITNLFILTQKIFGSLPKPKTQSTIWEEVCDSRSFVVFHNIILCENLTHQSMAGLVSGSLVFVNSSKVNIYK